ncbi:MAG: DUF4345 family protein [Bacteroidota bacterium]
MERAFVVASGTFLGVVTGRLISIGLEGMPNPEMIRATVVEGLLAVLNMLCGGSYWDFGS